MTVFDRIKELADNRGISVSKVATDLGFSENLFYQWKKASPKSDRLEKVADYFDVSVDYLLDRTNDPNPKNRNSAIKKPKVKMLARKMDGLDDSQLDALDNLVNQFFDKKFDKGSDEDK